MHVDSLGGVIWVLDVVPVLNVAVLVILLSCDGRNLLAILSVSVRSMPLNSSDLRSDAVTSAVGSASLIVVSVAIDMTSQVVVRHMLVLRLSILVARVSNGTTVVRAAWVRSGLELLLNSSMLVVTEVINSVGVLAIDNLAAMTIAMTAVTVTRVAGVR